MNKRNDPLGFSIFDSSRTSVSIVDRDTFDLPLIYVNDAFCKLAGYARSNVLGRNCRFLQGDLERVEIVENMFLELKNGVKTSLCLRNMRANGEVFNNFVYLAPVDDLTNERRYFLGCQFEFSTPFEIEEIALDHRRLSEYLLRLDSMRRGSMKALFDSMQMRANAAEARLNSYFAHGRAKRLLNSNFQVKRELSN